MDAKTIIMQEEKVSFQVAKLAKEKGFESNERPAYNIEGILQNTFNGEDTYYPAPTESLLQRWLREVHNIHITVYSLDKKYWCNFRNIKDEDTVLFISENYQTYEKVLEIGLFEALKLIKNK